IATDITPERLRRFFSEVDGSYRIAKPIRDMCVFAPHNLLRDPPFINMDLVSCRNLLVYLTPALQNRLVSRLHYALKSGGHLLLGRTESLHEEHQAFEVASATHRIFRKRAPHAGVMARDPWESIATGVAAPRPFAGSGVPDPVYLQVAVQTLLRHSPPAILVDSDLNVLQVSGDVAPYLLPMPLATCTPLTQLLRVPLRAALDELLRRMREARQALTGREVSYRPPGLEVILSAVPVGDARHLGGTWIIFGAPGPAAATDSAAAADGLPQGAARAQPFAADPDLLQQELEAVRHAAQISEQDLQSINEELQASKEEIQSNNEELISVNEELQSRNSELHQLNSDLNNLVGSAELVLLMLWNDLRIRRVTPAAQRYFHLMPSDIGRPMTDIRHPFETDELPALLAAAVRGESLEREVRDRNGRWQLLRVRPYRTLRNDIDGAVLTVTDIHLLREGQVAIARQAELLEHTRDAIFVHAGAGGIVYWNAGAEHLYGISRAEALGGQPQVLLQVDPDCAAAAQRALQERGEWHGELVVRRHDGATVVVHAQQILFHERGGQLTLETHHDITERCELERALQRRVRELAQADEAKNDFLAMLAHELRNPLAPLRNAVRILQAAPRDEALSERTRQLIDRQVNHLVRLVDDLLDAARLTRGRVQLRLETLPLQGVLTRVAESVRNQLEAQQHSLRLELPGHPILVEADSTRLDQVFSNLLHNASKYTQRGGHIEVVLEKPSAGEALVRVRDDGIGILPEVLPRVFDLFAQGDRSLERTQGGLGIGLHVVRTLVELHKGRVSAFSAGANQGSEFRVCLPVVEHVEPPAVENRAEMPLTSIGRSVLVVDDNQDIVDSMATLLRLHGYEVHTALDGAEALESAKRCIPDLVLLDIGMPGLDGYAVARRLRAEPALRDTLLVAVSGYGSAQDRARASAAGFDHHCVKPLDLSALALIERNAPPRGGATLQ
ncbi:MAG: PAS domain-containing protein, partial [Gammaproteobacteria bacterium]|nr:PAS domain-containing protein [Gammaproteobacteria bacterium]